MKNADLNLLVVFDAIMREGSMTRAANRLAMTQPAVSNAVSRMRRIWNDPVFVKRGRGITPTPHALEMWGRVRTPMDKLQEAANPDSFNPGSARRSFRIGTNDLCAGLTWRTLRRRAEQSSPGIDFHSVPNSSANVEELLFHADVDVVLSCALHSPRAGLRERTLGDSHYVCAMSENHPLASEPLSLESFLSADHLRVSPLGESTGFIDEILRARSRTRRIAMTVNHYAQVAPLLRESRLLSTVPFEAVAAYAGRDGLRITRPPFEIPPISLSLLWHERNDRDPGQRWLRKELESVIAESTLCHPLPVGIVSRRQQQATQKRPRTRIKSTAFG